LTVYRARSEYQLVVESLTPQGEGALRAAFDNLKRRLEAEGLFAPERKRPLPASLEKVALLTSPASAAANDFLTTSVKRTKLLSISLFPVPVQGREAAEEIAACLGEVNASGNYDLIVLTRGGGSLEDLWAFNEEILARAVAASRIPVLAAIGHSTDLSLAEMAADLKAITPTAAAETIWPLDSVRLERVERCRAELVKSARLNLKSRAESLASATDRLGRFRVAIMGAAQNLDTLTMRLEAAAGAVAIRGRARLESLERDLKLRSPSLELLRRAQRLAELRGRLKASADRRLAELASELRRAAERLGPPSRLALSVFERRGKLLSLSAKLEGAAREQVDGKRRAAAEASAKLSLVSPKRILSRGYAMVAGPDGRVMTRAAQAAVGQDVTLTMADGRILASVKRILDD
jgi:exodeoxyribonuclease VII large subunit